MDSFQQFDEKIGLPWNFKEIEYQSVKIIFPKYYKHRCLLS